MKANRVYRADFASHVVWLGLLALPLIPVVVAIAKYSWPSLHHDGLLSLAGLWLGALLTVAIWLSRYQLVFSSSGIAYRSWRGSWRASYAEISSVSASRSAPISGIPISATVHFKNGRQEIIFVKVFSETAIKELLAVDRAI